MRNEGRDGNLVGFSYSDTGTKVPGSVDVRGERVPRHAASQTSVHRIDELEGRLTEARTRAEVFERDDFRRDLERKLDELLEDVDRPSHSKVLSIDVFDTFLWRDASAEVTRFREVAVRMAKLLQAKGVQVRPVDALVARQLGTQASYRASNQVDGCREGSMLEIHRTASRLLAGNDRFVQAFIEAELDNEASHCIVSPFWSAYLARHWQRGGRAILVSDMYLHAEHIVALLSKLGVEPSRFALVLSSADTKVSKASGGVFPVIERALGEPATEFVHVGDSYKGDFAGARRRGWGSMLLPVPEAELAARRDDHRATMKDLLEADGIRLDVPMPH